MPDPAARLEQAQELLQLGRPARALARLRGAFPRELADEADFLRAEALRGQGFFGRAQALYEGLLDGAGADPALAIDAGLALASVHRSLGRVPQARERLKAAWTLARRRGEDAERFELEDALIDRAAGRWSACLRKLNRLLGRCRRERDHAGCAFLLWATGGARRFSGDLAGSERDFQESLALARRAGDPSGEAYALFGLGGVTRIRGRLEDSERWYRAARARLARTDDVFGQAYAECGLANSLRQQGRWAEAGRHYARAHVLYSSLGDAVDLAYVDWGLAQVAMKTGDLKAAERRLELALKGFATGDEQRGLALSRQTLAAVWHATGRTQAAEKLFDEAVRGARRAGLHAHLESFT